MFKMTRKITIAGLALILFGGVVSPSIVHADSTGTTDNATAATTKANDAVTYKIGSVELPYTTIATTSGYDKSYRFTKSPNVFTTAELNDNQQMQAFQSKYSGNTQSYAQQFVLAYTMLWSQPITVDPNESFVDFYSGFGGEGNDSSSSDYMTLIDAQTEINFTLLKELAQYKLGKITYSEFYQTYANNIRPAMLKSGVSEAQVKQYDGFFGSEENMNPDPNINSYDNVYSNLYPMIKDFTGLPTATDEQLAKIDVNSTKKLVSNIYNKPMKDYLTKQSDGTYQVDGAISLLSVTGVSFGGLPTDTTTPSIPDPTPTPSTSQPVTVHYVDDQGNTLKPDKTLTGKLGDSYKTEPLDIDGYGLTNTTGDETGTFGSTAKSVTYTYAPVITSGGDGDTIAPEGTVIYATKKIGLYKSATFTNKARKQWYAKKARINRPMFVVTGYAKSKNGVKRYQVKDVNHLSKTNGKTGYVTANAKYTSRVYYATKHKTITVINPKGVNAYSKKTLTNKKAHYKQGQVLKVKKIVNQNLTTRFVLSNGRYITANKMLVQSGKQTMPKRVQTKTALNRYSTANLTKQNKHVSAHAVLKVTGWTYSNANNFSKSDTLRYQVAGGYITGNKQLVRVFK